MGDMFHVITPPIWGLPRILLHIRSALVECFQLIYTISIFDVFRIVQLHPALFLAFSVKNVCFPHRKNANSHLTFTFCPFLLKFSIIKGEFPPFLLLSIGVTKGCKRNHKT